MKSDDSEWGCVGKVKKQKKPKVDAADYSVGLIELFSRMPFVGVTAKACAYDDPDCAQPLDQTVTGSDGLVHVTVPTGKDGFDGYLELTGNGIQPTLSFLNLPVVEDTVAPGFLVLTQATFQGFAAAAGVTLRPERGHIGMAAVNCLNAPAAGVTFTADTADQSSTRVCLGPMGPSANNPSTNASGHCGYFNVPLGEVTVSAVIAATGVTYGAATGYCRAGFNCEVAIPPTWKFGK